MTHIGRESLGGSNATEKKSIMHTPHRNTAASRPSPPLSSSPPLPGVGDMINERYRLDREAAARTEAGVVFDAYDLSLNRRVAVEIASSLQEPSARRKWSRDAMLAQRLEGEHVLRVLEVGNVGANVPYVVREAGLCTLAAELESKRALPIERAVGWTLEACEALAEAHALGMAHGDLRLDNVYLVRGAPEPQVKVAWTSAAKAERAAREDVARDIASLGVMLRLLVTGHTDADADGASTLPSDLAHAVARALAQEPSGKFNNVGELARALAPFAPPGHGSARAVAFLMSRAGIVGGSITAAPRASRGSSLSPLASAAVPAPKAPGSAPSVTDRLSFTDEWFGRPARSSFVPPAQPERNGRGFAFAVVSVALVSAALGGSAYLWESGRLPRWTGAAPPEAVGTTEVTSSSDESASADENARAALGKSEENARAEEEAKATEEANLRAQAEQRAAAERKASETRSTSVESLPNAPPATSTAAALVSAPPAHRDLINNAVPEIRGVTPPSSTTGAAGAATTAPRASATTDPAPSSPGYGASAPAPSDTSTAPSASGSATSPSGSASAPSADTPSTTPEPSAPSPAPTTSPSEPVPSPQPGEPAPAQPDPTSPY